MQYDMSPAGIEEAKRNGDWSAVEQIQSYMKQANQRRENSEGVDFDGDGRIGGDRNVADNDGSSSFIGPDRYGGAMRYDANGNWHYKDKFGGEYDRFGYQRGDTFQGNGGITYQKGSDEVKINGQTVDFRDFPHDRNAIETGAKFASLYEGSQATAAGDDGHNDARGFNRKAANETPGGALRGNPPADPLAVKAGVLAAEDALAHGVDPNRMSDQQIINAVNDKYVQLQIVLHERHRCNDLLKDNPNDAAAKARIAELDKMQHMSPEEYRRKMDDVSHTILRERLADAGPDEKSALLTALHSGNKTSALRALDQAFPTTIAPDSTLTNTTVTTIFQRKLTPLPTSNDLVDTPLTSPSPQQSSFVAPPDPAKPAASSFVSVLASNGKDEPAGIADPKMRELYKDLEMRRLTAELKRDPDSRELQERIKELKDMDKLPPDQYDRALIKLSNRLVQERWDALPQKDKEALDAGMSNMDSKVYEVAVRQMYAKEMPADPAPTAPVSLVRATPGGAKM